MSIGLILFMLRDRSACALQYPKDLKPRLPGEDVCLPCDRGKVAGQVGHLVGMVEQHKVC